MKNEKNRKKNFWENFRFEFVLYINNGRREESDHIICQRLFDVKGFNEEVLSSLELKEVMDEIAGVHNGRYGDMGLIPKFFKEQSKDVCWKLYKPYLVSKNEPGRDIFENEDLFTFEIKLDKKTIAKSVFSGNWFQTDVRYAVNIRKIIPTIIEEIQNTFSQKAYTTTYEGYDLKKVIEEVDFKVD
jgi:hypothetical protein